MKSLKVAFDALPLSHWAPLFHVLRLEQPTLRLEWRRMGFPSRERSLLQSADVGLFVEPPREAGLSALTIETNRMLVLTAVGHRLAQNHELRVADILDQPFPGCPRLHPQWLAFWTLDEQRGGPPPLTDDRVENAEEALSVVAAGRAIATIPATVAGALPHPGVIALPLRDGPPVATRLVWRSDDENPIVHSLIELAAAMTCDPRPDGPRSPQRTGRARHRGSRSRTNASNDSETMLDG
jgi:DNA-binding transcriptional LysR family regulator